MEPPRTGEALYLEEQRNGEQLIGWLWESAKHPGFYHYHSMAILHGGGGLETTSPRPCRWSMPLEDGTEWRMTDATLPKLGFYNPTVSMWKAAGVIDLCEDLHATTMNQLAYQPPVPKGRKKSAEDL